MNGRYCWYKVLLVLALGSTAVVAGPALADTGPGGPSPGVPGGISGGSSPSGTVTDTGGSSDDGDDSDLGALDPEGPPGPVGFTDVPTFETIRVPGELLPTEVNVLVDDDDVELSTYNPEDQSSYMALIVIDNGDAATEYRFEKAVPPGHIATLQPDGSIRFFDSDGDETGGIAAPWALDANGEEVSTSYALDGDTLVQTVEHHDATYPVVADPWWYVAYVVVGRCMASASCANLVIAVISHGPVTARVVYNAVSNGSTPSSSTNTCNMGVSFASGC